MLQQTATIERKADFWWVIYQGRPCYPCVTKAEAIEIANELNRRPAGVPS